MKTHSRRYQIPTVLALLALCLAGCGGGGGGSATPAPAKSATPAPTPAAPAGEPAAPPPASGAAGPHGTATITGSVRYEGEVPAMKPIDMAADPGCAKKHTTPAEPELLVLGAGNTVGNVYVHVAGGLPAGSYPPPAQPAEIDQDGCRYKPHVLGIVRGQKLKFVNSDGLLHNVHALPEVNKPFNMAMPATRTEAEVTFTETESMFKIKCDVHPWMGAWVAVSDHPFFAVTGTDGRFEIRGLPAGSYEIEAWHEKLGTQKASVTVADGASASADFVLKR